MNPDKKVLFEIVSLLDKISFKLNSELSTLKSKINYSVFRPQLKNYHINFLQNILIPLSNQKLTFSILDIKLMCKKIKPLSEATIRCYLSVLKRNNHVSIRKNQDKRGHLYQLI